jgi:hypothetical protein
MKKEVLLTVSSGRAIAQAASRRLPTSATRVRAHIRSCGICGGQSSTGAGFFQVLRFPLPILIPPTAPHSSSSNIRGWYNRPISGRRTKWTLSHPIPRNLKKNYTFLRSIGKPLPDFTTSHTRKYYPPWSSLREPQIQQFFLYFRFPSFICFMILTFSSASVLVRPSLYCSTWTVNAVSIKCCSVV